MFFGPWWVLSVVDDELVDELGDELIDELVDEELLGVRSVLLVGKLSLNSVVELNAVLGSVDEAVIELYSSVVVVERVLSVEVVRSSSDVIDAVTGDREVGDRSVESDSWVVAIGSMVVGRFDCDSLKRSHSFSMFV